VFSWPSNYDSCFTLSGPLTRDGVGLHSGEKTSVKIMPFDEEGYYVSFADKPSEIFKLDQSLIGSTMLCTAVKLGKRNLYTIEHLLSSFAGCGISYIHIEVDGKEIPLLDGSAIQWVRAFEEVGVKRVPKPDNFLKEINNSRIFNKDSSVIAVTPSDRLTIISTIDFKYKAIGKQTYIIDLNPKCFVEMIAPARTFGFKDQFQELSELGLIKGGSLDNALVCDGETWVNPPLRFTNEPIRHKILDLIGDLALVGLPKAQIMVYKGSHSLNALLASSLTS
tara:strand:+ start:1768 stop:2604 length:837 start_codon:yes stop_codon:yes gene_type:complete